MDESTPPYSRTEYAGGSQCCPYCGDERVILSQECCNPASESTLSASEILHLLQETPSVPTVQVHLSGSFSYIACAAPIEGLVSFG